MFANELMINDWVINRGAKVRVVALDAYDHEIETEVTHKGDNGVRVKEVAPIPLTPEIMMANGFKLEQNDYVWTDDVHSPEQVYIAISFRRDGTVRIVDVHNFRCQFFSDRLTYGYTVHELQRALRCCGLWELADNLKIE